MSEETRWISMRLLTFGFLLRLARRFNEIPELSQLKFIWQRSWHFPANDLSTFSSCRIEFGVEQHQFDSDRNQKSSMVSFFSSEKKIFEDFRFSLEMFNLQSNKLSSLPSEICSLRRLREILLNFNLFKEVPAPLAYLTKVRYSDVTALCLAGNSIRKLTVDVIQQ